MKLLTPAPRRIFLIAWILYSVHFATNVVREHYPAFSLAEHGTFFVDEYQGFHSDIFVHPNGHSVIGNQVLVSALAAVPLFLFGPVLDSIESYSKAKLLRTGSHPGEYRTDKPKRVAFYRLVRERGLELRFGAATLITTVFFMAPLTALFLTLFYRVLRERGVGSAEASGLTFLLGFATPLFFRATVLGHNMFLMYEMFIAFVLLWQSGPNAAISQRWRLAAGFFGGLAIATDYMGVIVLPLLYGYMLIRTQPVSLKTYFRDSMVFAAGSIPPLLFLFYSQWAMYGNPFLPGQHWMPDQNAYTQVGMRGFDWPAPDLILKNLFDPGYGLYTWGPLLLLGLVPAFRYRPESLILPRRERRFVALSFLALLLFSSANQYARLQWNSGFRYLLPLVPFIMLALADHWVRLPKWIRVPAAIAVAMHSWVIAVFRETSIWTSWNLFLAEGVQLPWLRVLRMTSPPDNALLNTQFAPAVILSIAVVLCWLIWSCVPANEDGISAVVTVDGRTS